MTKYILSSSHCSITFFRIYSRYLKKNTYESGSYHYSVLHVSKWLTFSFDSDVEAQMKCSRYVCFTPDERIFVEWKDAFQMQRAEQASVSSR